MGARCDVATPPPALAHPEVLTYPLPPITCQFKVFYFSFVQEQQNSQDLQPVRLRLLC